MTIKDLYQCLNGTNKYGYEIEYFWISGVFLVFVGFLGLFGNLLSLVVLFQATFRKETFYRLLVTMTFVDIYCIICFGIQSGYSSMVCTEYYSPAIWDLTKYFANAGRSLSVYTTVAVSIERFLKVRHPFMVNRPKAWHYIVFILLFSFSYNIPEFFERKFFVINGTLYDELKPYAEDDDYCWRYWMVTDFIVFLFENIVSSLIIVILNVAIIKTVWSSKKNVMSVGYIHQRRKSVTRHSSELTRTLFIFVVIFLLTRSLYICVHYFYYFSDYEKYENWIYLEPIEGLLLMINSSIYVVIYFIVDTKFRQCALRFINCQVWRNGPQSTTIYTSNA